MLWPGILYGGVTSAFRGTPLGPGLVSSGDGNTLSYHCPVSHHSRQQLLPEDKEELDVTRNF